MDDETESRTEAEIASLHPSTFEAEKPEADIPVQQPMENLSIKNKKKPFAKKFAGVERMFKLTVVKCKNYLHRKEVSPSLTIVNHCIRACDHRRKLIRNCKFEGFFGSYVKDSRLLEIEKGLADLKNELLEERERLEALGFEDAKVKYAKVDGETESRTEAASASLTPSTSEEIKSFSDLFPGTERTFELVEENYKSYLARKESKPSLTTVNRYIEACSHRHSIIQAAREKGMYGDHAEDPRLLEILGCLRSLEKELVDEKARLEELGFKDMRDVYASKD